MYIGEFIFGGQKGDIQIPCMDTGKCSHEFCYLATSTCTLPSSKLIPETGYDSFCILKACTSFRWYGIYHHMKHMLDSETSAMKPTFPTCTAMCYNVGMRQIIRTCKLGLCHNYDINISGNVNINLHGVRHMHTIVLYTFN